VHQALSNSRCRCTCRHCRVVSGRVLHHTTYYVDSPPEEASTLATRGSDLTAVAALLDNIIDALSGVSGFIDTEREQLLRTSNEHWPGLRGQPWPRATSLTLWTSLVSGVGLARATADRAARRMELENFMVSRLEEE
jgi:hypothetical protein